MRELLPGLFLRPDIDFHKGLHEDLFCFVVEIAAGEERARFFQDFLKTSGILEQLEQLGIAEGDTVRMYGLAFDYYK